MSDTAKVSDMVIILQPVDKDEICLQKIKCVSKTKPRLRTESIWVMGGFDGR